MKLGSGKSILDVDELGEFCRDLIIFHMNKRLYNEGI